MKNIFTGMSSPDKKCTSNMDVVASPPVEAAMEAGRNNEAVSIIIDRCLSKIFLAMKLTVPFVLVACLQVSAHVVDAQRITYAKKNVSLEKVFNAIRKQTGYEFLYNTTMLGWAKKEDLKFSDTPLKVALEGLFKNQPLTYTIVGKTIVVKRKREKSSVSASEEILFKEVHGIVIDSTTGEPLAGVTIKVKGGTIGTVTDANGAFSLNVSEGAVLEVSSVGYSTKTVSVGGASSFEISLARSATGLNQLVVVGYGKQEKKSVTSAISTLNADNVKDVPVTALGNSLGGRVAGVITHQTNGEPGVDAPEINIRGVSTIGNTAPLVIVDGIPRDFQDLDPNSIESFTILKDAAATAPYGVAGANGVILITTKEGKKGTVRVNYNGYVGFQSPTVLWDQVNGYQYATLYNKGLENEGLPPKWSESEVQKFKDGSEPDRYPPYKDIWGAVMKKPSILTAHSINVSGGIDKIRYFFDLGYQSQEGMWPTSGAKRYNLSLNLNGDITKTTKFSLKINGNIKTFRQPPSDVNSSHESSTVRTFESIKYAEPGRGALKYSNGAWGTYIMATLYNSGYRKITNGDLYTQFSLSQELPFIKGLKIGGEIAYDPNVYKSKLWTVPVVYGKVDTSVTPYVITQSILGADQSSLKELHQINTNYTYRARIDYDRSFDGVHNLSVSGIFEAINRKFSSLGAERTHYGLNLDEITMGSSDKKDQNNSGMSSEEAQVGLVYRLTYNYREKYFFEATGRYDGHYYFAPKKRYGFFPAFSVGWRLSEESFFKRNVTWIDNLKIRASYGEVGALAGGPYQYMSLYNLHSPGYAIGGAGVITATEGVQANPNITWERAKKTDIGIDLLLWNNLVNLTIDYFYQKRSNMLVSPNVTVSNEYGIGLSQVNKGVMQNQGIDATVGFNKRISNDFSFGLGGTLTFSRNKVLNTFESKATYDNPNRRRTGRPLGTQFGYKALGYFTEEDFKGNGELKPGFAYQPWGDVHPGDLRYQDTNGDGKIDVNDYVPIGDPTTPSFIYGFTPHISFHGFSLNVLFQGIVGMSHYFDGSAMWPFFNGRSAYVQNFDYWAPDNKDAKFPRITSSPTTNNTQHSSKWMFNMNYLRLKSAKLSYDVPKSLLEKLNIESLQIYLSGQNILTWAGYVSQFYDPESVNGGGYTYPQQRVISVGLNLSF